MVENARLLYRISSRICCNSLKEGLRYIAIILSHVTRRMQLVTRCNAIACRFACRFYFRVNRNIGAFGQSAYNCLVETIFLFPRGKHVHRNIHVYSKRNEIPLVFSHRERFRRRVARQKSETADRSAATRLDMPCLEFPAW